MCFNKIKGSPTGLVAHIIIKAYSVHTQMSWLHMGNKSSLTVEQRKSWFFRILPSNDLWFINCHGWTYSYVQFCLQSVKAETSGAFTHGKKLKHVNLHLNLFWFNCTKNVRALYIYQAVWSPAITEEAYAQWINIKCYNRSSFSITKQIYIIHKNVPSLLQLIFS